MSLTGTVTAASGFLDDSDTFATSGPVTAELAGFVLATIDDVAATIAIESTELSAALAGSLAATSITASIANEDQFDSNGDAIGDLCDPDMSGLGGVEDCVVNFIDLQDFRSAFFATPKAPTGDPDADLNNDGTVNFVDLVIARRAFFGPPGPSAAGCD